MRKRLCPKCGQRKDSNQFLKRDKKGGCNACRKFRDPEATRASDHDLITDDAPIICSSTELRLSTESGMGISAPQCTRVVVIQRIGGVVRISTGRRVKRSVTSALVLGGTVLLPIENLPAICAELMAASQDVD